MTLIAGIKCSDGIVMGADGAATYATVLGATTVVQPTSKLQALRGKVLMGVSGQIGLGQLYCGRVGTAWDNKEFGNNVTVENAQRKLRDIVAQESQPSKLSSQGFGGNTASLLVTTSLVALPIGGFNGQSELIRIDDPGVAEALSKDLPYAAIGSGQALADPFLAFLRNIFWRDSLPTVSDGIFAVTWTLRHAIDVSPGGVSDPIQLGIIERGKGQEWTARILEDDDLDEHLQHVSEAESYLRDFQNKGQEEIPPLPQPDPID